MRVLDISLPLTQHTPIWPGDPPLAMDEFRFGNTTVSRISMGLHTGTHLDVPYHFLPDGKKVDDYPLDRFIGKALVCSITSTSAIQIHELKSKTLGKAEIVLFKTINSSLWQQQEFSPGFIGLEEDAARYLVDCGIKLVGIDYLSIQPYSDPKSTVHTILLGNDVVILEGLDLNGIDDGEYMLFCCPLHIPDVEASPVRAMLISFDELRKVVNV